MMVTATLPEKEAEPIPSVKDLASSEPSIRRKSLQQILSHLETRSSSNHLTHTQALQLWRGFHVALYMHDSKNQLSVQTLIATLASTFKTIRAKDSEFASESTQSNSATSQASSIAPHSNKRTIIQSTDEAEDDFAGFDDGPAPTSELSSTWLAIYSSAFWETIAREWSSVDQWRMNKYLLLIRFVLREIFIICLSSYFEVEAIPKSQQQNDPGEEESRDQATKTKTKKRKSISSDEFNASQTKQYKKSKTTIPSNPPPPSTIHQTSNHDPTTLKSQLHILQIHPLSPRSRQTSDGLRLHVLDIYLDELLRAANTLKSQHESISSIALQDILITEFTAPIQEIATEGLAKHVRTRAKEVLGEFEGRIAKIV